MYKRQEQEYLTAHSSNEVVTFESQSAEHPIQVKISKAAPAGSTSTGPASATGAATTDRPGTAASQQSRATQQTQSQNGSGADAGGASGQETLRKSVLGLISFLRASRLLPAALDAEFSSDTFTELIDVQQAAAQARDRQAATKTRAGKPAAFGADAESTTAGRSLTDLFVAAMTRQESAAFITLVESLMGKKLKQPEAKQLIPSGVKSAASPNTAAADAATAGGDEVGVDGSSTAATPKGLRFEVSGAEVPSHRTHPSIILVEKYRRLLCSLRSLGVLVGNIAPEYLMNPASYAQLVNGTSTCSLCEIVSKGLLPHEL